MSYSRTRRGYPPKNAQLKRLFAYTTHKKMRELMADYVRCGMPYLTHDHVYATMEPLIKKVRNATVGFPSAMRNLGRILAVAVFGGDDALERHQAMAYYQKSSMLWMLIRLRSFELVKSTYLCATSEFHLSGKIASHSMERSLYIECDETEEFAEWMVDNLSSGYKLPRIITYGKLRMVSNYVSVARWACGRSQDREDNLGSLEDTDWLMLACSAVLPREKSFRLIALNCPSIHKTLSLRCIKQFEDTREIDAMMEKFPKSELDMQDWVLRVQELHLSEQTDLQRRLLSTCLNHDENPLSRIEADLRFILRRISAMYDKVSTVRKFLVHVYTTTVILLYEMALTPVHNLCVIMIMDIVMPMATVSLPLIYREKLVQTVNFAAQKAARSYPSQIRKRRRLRSDSARESKCTL